MTLPTVTVTETLPVCRCIQADLQLNMVGIHSPPAGDEAQLALRMRSSRQKATANIVPAQLLHLSRD